MLRYILTLILFSVVLFIGTRVGDQLTYGKGELVTGLVPLGEAREVAFVAHPQTGVVSLVDPETNVLIADINAIPDGKQISYFRDLTQALGGEADAIAQFGEVFISDMKVSPDGRALYVSRGVLGDVIALEIATGDPYWRQTVGGNMSAALALSQTGDRLFVNASQRRFEVIETQGSASSAVVLPEEDCAPRELWRVAETGFIAVNCVVTSEDFSIFEIDPVTLDVVDTTRSVDGDAYQALLATQTSVADPSATGPVVRAQIPVSAIERLVAAASGEVVIPLPEEAETDTADAPSELNIIESMSTVPDEPEAGN